MLGKVLLGLIIAAVLAAILVPTPAPQDLFGLGIQTLSAQSEEDPLGLATLLDRRIPPTEGTAPLPLAVRSIRLQDFPPTWDAPALQAQVRAGVVRALNQLNGDPPSDWSGEADWQKIVLAEDAAAAEASIDIEVRRFQNDHQSGIEMSVVFAASFLEEPLRIEPSPPLRFSEPDRTSLYPPLLAIVLAMLCRKVLLSLFAGVWLAGILLTYSGQLSSPWNFSWDLQNYLVIVAEGFLRVFDTFLLNELINTFRVEIIGFVLFLSAAIGVMSMSGGMRGFVQIIARMARGVRSTQMVSYLLGLLIFFDDYANCILVGSTMRPATDRMRIAREKLAFLVDATAAPVAALCILSTWIAFEVSTFSEQLPSVGITESGYAVFLQTLPYRFYAIFMIGFIFLNIVLQRDFGPMLTAERRARRTGQLVRPEGRPMVSGRLTELQPSPEVHCLARRALIPIATILLVTIAMIWREGGGPLPSLTRDPFEIHWPTINMQIIQGVLYDGSGGRPILYGSFAGLVVALFLGLGIGPRIGLVGGWLVAAQLTPPLLSVVQPAVETALEQASGSAGSYLQTRLDLSPDSAIVNNLQYLLFFALFLVLAIVLGFLASAMIRSDPARRPEGRLLSLEAFRAALLSTQALFFAVLILFLAWMTGNACTQLGTASYLVALVGDSLPYWMLPILLFLISCVVSFSTGSSWSTMGILLPIVVGLAFHVGEAHQPDTSGMALLVLCIGAVLEGSIFGDHCSPISDTTVLSSVSSASDHIDHVRTQMPYAIAVMLTALLLGYLPQSLGLWPVWMSMALGLAALLVLLVLVGRHPGHAPVAPDEDESGESSQDPGSPGTVPGLLYGFGDGETPASGPPWQQ